MKIISKEKIVVIALVMLLFITFFVININSFDSDLGWHIRLGGYILQHGLPRVDPFSYTMQSFPYIDHEWLSNIMIYLIYQRGIFFLGLFFAIFPTLAVLIPFLKKKGSVIGLGFYLLGIAAILPFSGMRVQSISWVFLSILLFVLLSEKLWVRWRMAIPLLILIWVNLHGGFAVSIFALAIFLALRFFSKKLTRLDVVVFILSLLVTFINPYGIRLWSEVLSSGLDLSLRFEIQEWLPLVFLFNFPLVFLLSVLFGLGSQYYKKLSLIEIGLFFAFLLLAASSVRHAPFLIIITLYVLGHLTNLLFMDLKKSQQVRRFRIVSYFFVALAVIFFSYAFYSVLNAQVLFKKTYPDDAAITYLSKNAVRGQIFSSYAWGGYLDWKLPQKKVFIDGRMPSWKWKAPNGQSDSAFKEYINLIKGKESYRLLFEKYGVEYVFLPKKNNSENSLDLINFNWFGASSKAKAFSLGDELDRDGWKKVYESDVSVVYKQPR